MLTEPTTCFAVLLRTRQVAELDAVRDPIAMPPPGELRVARVATELD
jgi:hypothetical protein